MTRTTTSPREEDWTKEFDRRFVPSDYWVQFAGGGTSSQILQPIKSFIASLLQKERERKARCGKLLPDGSICGVVKDCHLHDWRQRDQIDAAKEEGAKAERGRILAMLDTEYRVSPWNQNKDKFFSMFRRILSQDV